MSIGGKLPSSRWFICAALELEMDGLDSDPEDQLHESLQFVAVIRRQLLLELREGIGALRDELVRAKRA